MLGSRLLGQCRRNGWENATAYLPELDLSRTSADHYLVAVGEEVAAELEQRARLRCGDRAGREQIARPERRSARRHVRDELRAGPVERARIAACEHARIELELEVDVEGPV